MSHPDIGPRQSPAPGAVPASSPTRWLPILRAALAEMFSDHLRLTAAGLAFYGLLGLVPALAAVAALYGLVGNPSDLAGLVDQARGLLPDEAASVLSTYLRDTPGKFGLGLGFAVSLLLVLWTAQWAASGMITALNIVFDETEKRSFLKRQVVALGIALGGILILICALALVALMPFALVARPGSSGPELFSLLLLARWPLLAVVLTFAIELLFCAAPSRSCFRWQWVSWGAVSATLLFLIASAGFSAYVAHVGSFGRLYGSMGAVVMLLVWFYLTGLAVLLGAEIDAAVDAHRSGRGPCELKRALRERQRAAAARMRSGETS
jgi:membrane protein